MKTRARPFFLFQEAAAAFSEDPAGCIAAWNEILVRNSAPDAGTLAPWREVVPCFDEFVLVCREAWHTLHGRWKALRGDAGKPAASIEQVPAEARPFWLDRLLLHWNACLRTGEGEAAAVLLDALRSAAPFLDTRASFDCVEIEQCAMVMGCSLFQMALHRLAELEGVRELPSFWRLRFHIIRGICYQGLGKYDLSHREIQEQARVMDGDLPPVLHLTLQRRRLGLLIESENYAAAELLADEIAAPMASTSSPTVRAMYLQECLRLALIRNESAQVDCYSRTIQEVIEGAGLTSQVMSLIEEQCEIDLRREQPDAAIRKIQAQLWHAQVRGEVGGQCVAHLILARALALKGSLLEAEIAAQNAVSLADRYEFGKARVRALLFLAGILHATEDDVRARLALSRARHLAGSMRLGVQLACCEFLSSLLSKGKVRIRTLMQAVHRSRSLAELAGYLSFYGIELDQSVLVSLDDGGRVSLRMVELARQMLMEPAVYWIEGEAVLLRTTTLELLEEDFETSPLLGKTVAYLFRHMDRGVSIERLHELHNPGIAYRPFRHLARCQALFSRLRRVMEKFGLALVYDKSMGTYRIRSGALPLRIVRQTRRLERAVASPASPKRETEILDLLRAHERLSAAEIARRLGITRQTIHPLMQQMVNKGLLRLRKRGRSSVYVLR